MTNDELKKIVDKIDELKKDSEAKYKELKDNLGKILDKLGDLKDRLETLESKAAFYDYVSSRFSDHVPQPISNTPVGNAVNEQRRFWRSERPYRR